ncbi:MAG: hypothetical protein M1354_01670 [Candidatus Marsarchaeota archaeon]|jgi:hypothetical protein|nr:hypothetical protein [Candidatus Marsarchaeota archaeon]
MNLLDTATTAAMEASAICSVIAVDMILLSKIAGRDQTSELLFNRAVGLIALFFIIVAAKAVI